MSTASTVTKVWHALWGGGTLLRVEGTDWIVQLEPSGKRIRVPAELRRQFEIASHPVSPAVTNGDTSASSSNAIAEQPKPTERYNPAGVNALLRTLADREAQVKTNGHVPPQKPLPTELSAPRFRKESTVALGQTAWSSIAPWHKKRAIESLANGLPPAISIGRQLAVAFDSTAGRIDHFLREIADDGGSAVVVKGGYGQGKTFALRCLEEIALEAGFLVARTEIDATENRLNKPPHIYRDFLRHLRVPNEPGHGAAALAAAANAAINKQTGSRCADSRFRLEWLERNLGCAPLAWLFADPQIDAKQALVGLLACDPAIPTPIARSHHCITGFTRLWPAFTAGSQGDFGSYLLSGIGRLARVMGFQGLVLIMDEMEKWQDLNWNEQSRASNLLGGLIWGATARTDRGRRPTHQASQWFGLPNPYPRGLTHSGRGGFPFSTEAPCHVGLAIAMTPRSEEETPERHWAEFGPLNEITLPRLDTSELRRYCEQVRTLFSDAYGTREPSSDEMTEISESAVRLWRTHGELTNRAAVQSAVAAFHDWRDRTVFSDAV